ncbi:MAG: hypothetical protein MJZ32_08595 [Bacteroidaceae bacterium]|nr:hypothetical protein [Bacteroidaceae bacterium]
MTTATYPKMTQAQAMISMYLTMSKKSKDEFKHWFFENEQNSVSTASDNEISPELMASIEEGRKQIREGKCTRCRTKEDLDKLFASL